MELKAGERAVLGLVAELVLERFQDAYSIASLESRWPDGGGTLYSEAFRGLVEKGFIHSPPDDACFAVTDRGYQAMGFRFL